MIKKRKAFGSRAASFLTAFGCQMLMSSFVWACPRCVDATPYKSGMQWAVVFLLPIPLGLGTGLFLWLRKAAQNEDPS